MKLAYIITKYPCKSETFASRELWEMRRIGHDITIFAATQERDIHEDSVASNTLYRTCLFSKHSLKCVFYITIRFPIGILRLALFILKLMFIKTTEALSLLRNIGTIATFAYHLNRSKITHVHAYFLSWPALMAVAISKITRCTYSISAHARDIYVESGALNAKISHASFVAVCSEAGHTFLRQRLPASKHDKLHLVHHGIDHLLERRKPHSDSVINNVRRSDIVAIGRLVEKKGFVFLLMAFALVRETNPKTQLVIIGDGPQKEPLLHAATALGISSSTRFAGWLDETTTAEILRNSTILVTPSVMTHEGDQDGIPNVILEAHREDTPVIASNCGGISAIVQHFHTGWLVEPRNVEELATAITTLLQDLHLRQKLQNNARLSCRQHFDIRPNVQLLSHLMETCIAK